jgi:hypothetical protein
MRTGVPNKGRDADPHPGISQHVRERALGNTFAARNSHYARSISIAPGLVSSRAQDAPLQFVAGRDPAGGWRVAPAAAAVKA